MVRIRRKKLYPAFLFPFSIHALAMDSQHLRFNQTDASVSLMLKTGFLAKNQLPSVKPDPTVVPSLA